jgi:hypothetical protein
VWFPRRLVRAGEPQALLQTGAVRTCHSGCARKICRLWLQKQRRKLLKAGCSTAEASRPRIVDFCESYDRPLLTEGRQRHTRRQRPTSNSGETSGPTPRNGLNTSFARRLSATETQKPAMSRVSFWWFTRLINPSLGLVRPRTQNRAKPLAVGRFRT